MKRLLFFLMSLPLFASAQSTINPDTVCYQTPGSTYSVDPLGPGYTYVWTVSAPGIINAGQGSNAITVDWSAAGPGLIPNAVEVYAQNAQGCQSTPIDLNVFIYQVVPVITPIGPFCVGEPCVNLAGFPLGGAWAGPGVANGQFCPTTAGAGIQAVSYTYTNGGCTFVAQANVTVNALPVLNPIEHN